MAIEIVDFPIKNGDSHCYVSSPEGMWVVYDIALLALKLDATHGTLQMKSS